VNFPACRHAKRKPPASSALVWLGGEPYRLFFLTGALFSIAGVLLWPLFFRWEIGGFPNVSHARVMTTAFGGAFVIGFLGTAGPRILSAPKLKPWELVPLFLLHLGSGICHLLGKTFAGDLLFVALLLGLIASLAVRFLRFREDAPPPPLLLAATGLLCGLAGTVMGLDPSWLTTTERYRFAGLLLNQGFLLAPVMGVGVFLFPRLLGQGFGEPKSAADARRLIRHMLFAAGLLVAGFVVDAWFHRPTGLLMRAAAFAFVLAHVRWRRAPGLPAAGTLANALRGACVPLALAGLVLPALVESRQIGFSHLLYVTGFGLVCLIVGSRVLFGHSGSVERFANRSWTARLIVAAVVLAALTRISADFLPRVAISHFEYAAWTWVAAAGAWTVWHARRFFGKDPTE
jgi:uncharacterized protein involved in response to NO